jgi:hypothetical protein
VSNIKTCMSIMKGKRKFGGILKLQREEKIGNERRSVVR